MQTFDYVLKNVLIADGSGRPLQKGAVALQTDKIAFIQFDSASAPHVKGKKTIDGNGCLLAPGFIDIHGHTDHFLCVGPQCSSKISQGVTTEVFGNCGYSPIIRKKYFRKHFQAEQNRYGIQDDWHDLASFNESAESHRPALNWMTLVGHGSLRIAAMGHESRAPRSDEKKWMMRELEKALEQGACGLSTGLIYTPGCFAKTGEIAGLAKAMNKKGGFYATHMRSEGNQLVESIRESILISRQANVPLQISHLKTAGEKNWSKLEKAFEILEKGIDSGCDITWDRYPYDASFTSLDTCLPRELFDGGDLKAVERLRNIKLRNKTVRNINGLGERFGKTLIADIPSPKNKRWMGLSLSECSKEAGKSIGEFVVQLLMEEKMQVYAIFFSMSDENLKHILSHPRTMIGSDASARSRGKTFARVVHPRTYGTFPRFLRKYSAKKDVFSLPAAVRKMTGLTADRLELKKRGYIKEGHYADLVLIDLKEIRDRATYQSSTEYPEGIKMVFVNGKMALDHGRESSARSGRFIPFGEK
jgi:N-acyl-D-amino-acid deacylase